MGINQASRFIGQFQLQARHWLLCCLCGVSLTACTHTTKPTGEWPAKMPSMQKSFDLQGHRGARGLLPENSIPGFIHALELGVDTLEMDVVINAEGHVVVSHEPWMAANICSHPDGRPVKEEEQRSLNIYTMDDAGLASFDCGSRQHPDFPRQRVLRTSKPLLSDVFIAVNRFAETSQRPPVRFNIEIKSRPEFDGIYHPPVDEFALALYQVIRDFGLLDRSSIQSFDPRALEAVHRIDPSAASVWLISNRNSLADNLAMLSFKPTIYSPDYRLVNPQLVAQLRDLDIQLIPWTVNEPEAMRQLIEWGVDGLITDYPDTLLAVVAEMNPASGKPHQATPEL